MRGLASFILLLLLLPGAGWAVAQTAVFTSSAAPTYAFNISFQLITGAVAVPIERVDLFMQAAQAERPFTVEAIRVSQADGQLRADVDVDPVDAALPPFAEVRFWWELHTTAGETIVVPEETFVYEDDRFTWRVLEVGDVIVHWTGNDADLGQLAADIVAESRQTLDAILPQTAVSPLNLYIYPSTADLRSGLRLAGRDWQAGHTDPDLGVLLVTAVNPLTAAADLAQTIPHELTHLRLYQLKSGHELPLWYEEGLAMLAEGSLGDADLLATAVAEQTTLPVRDLCLAFPEEEGAVDLALAQSASLLAYIRMQFGDQALRQLGTNYLASAGCEAGLTQTLDMPVSDLQADWLATLAPESGWRNFFAQNGLWLLLVLASFGFMALLLRRQ